MAKKSAAKNTKKPIGAFGNKRTNQGGNSGFVSESTAGWNYRMKYDPDFAGKVYAGFVGFALAARAIYALYQGDQILAMMILGVSVIIVPLILFLYPKWLNYSLASSKGYCSRMLGPNAPDFEMNKCIDKRQSNDYNSGSSTTISFS